MKKLLTLFYCFLTVYLVKAQTNLNLSSTATASASSSGSYGPSNWNDGILNGATFGWVGTDPNMPTPSYMEFSWSTPQNFDSIVIHNVGSNFAPPNGNGVVFNGTADLEYYDGSQWLNITSFSGQGTYGDSYALVFSPVSASKFRVVNLNTGTNPVNHNPGFDEVQVYLRPQPAVVTDAELTSVDTVLLVGNKELVISAVLTNVGNQLIDSVEVSYQVSNSTAVLSESFQVLLAPNDDTNLVFSQTLNVDTLPSPIATEDLCVWATVGMDTVNSNDTLCISLMPLNSQQYSLPEVSVIYPNPSSGSLEIVSRAPISQVSIYRLDGKLVFRQKAYSAFQLSLDTDLPCGTYLLAIENDDQREFKRIVIGY